MTVVALGLDGHSTPYTNETLPLCQRECLESEACDWFTLLLPAAQLELLETVKRAAKPNTPIVLVTYSGGALDPSSIAEDPRINAMLWSGYPGEAGGLALRSILFGEESPSGRLSQIFYREEFLNEISVTDMRMRPSEGNSGEAATPGRGYRFYTGHNELYPFGYGM